MTKREVVRLVLDGKRPPYGTAADMKNETRCLLKLGSAGGYIFAPAHSVEGDVPLENMLAFIETVQGQPAFHKNSM
jgi:uroporphyrinogen-III decarboxylase